MVYDVAESTPDTVWLSKVYNSKCSLISIQEGNRLRRLRIKQLGVKGMNKEGTVVHDPPGCTASPHCI